MLQIQKMHGLKVSDTPDLDKKIVEGENKVKGNTVKHW